MYSNGALWYMHNGTLRLLEIRHSPTKEVVVDLSSILDRTTFKTQPKAAGSFSFLYYHKGILACLFRYSHPRRGGWLIAVDVKKRAILLSSEVTSTEKLFARHNGDYLYYGVRISNEYDNRKRWVLYGYDLRNDKFLGRNNFLHDLIGAEIGSTICFEIVGEYFYAVSNQTTYEVEEVDWTSFYHGRRFPLNDPSEKKLEKTEDQCMWRRQHLEGPLDDRWTNLALAIDETTGQLTIVESRKEWLQGRTVGQRTVYKTKVVFPEWPPKDKNNSSCQANAALALSTASPNTLQPFGTVPLQALPTDYPSSSSDEHQRRKALAVLTQDRLALTITASNKPHFSPSQIRLPRNVHTESAMLPGQRSFVVTKTPATYYDVSASAFVDLVNDIPQADLAVSQCLRIRACSRHRKGPAYGSDGIIPPLSRNPETGEPEEGLDEEYEDGSINMWPPGPDIEGHYSEAGRELHSLMNPPGYIGKVQGTFDGTALVYSTGQEGMQKAIVMVNFDPAVHLRGLKKCSMDDLEAGSVASATSRASTRESSGRASPKRPNSSSFTTPEDSIDGPHLPKRAKRSPSPLTSSPTGAADAATGEPEPCPWLRIEPAMYLSLSRGFDFAL